MRIKNRWLRAAWESVLVGLCAAALIMDFHGAGPYLLNYFTVLSNIACGGFFALTLVIGQRPRTQGVVVFCIAVTGLVYALMLAPDDIAAGRWLTFENLTLHYIVPAMAAADWLAFGPKGSFLPTDPLKWLLAPLGYFGYILLRSLFAGPIGGEGSRFPYGFIDPEVQGGWGEMFWGVAYIAIAMAALGYAIYTIDWMMRGKTGNNR